MLVTKNHIPHLPEMSVFAHKGTNGHVGLIVSSKGLEGAGDLSAISALRAGAGKATVLCESECEKFFSLRHSEVTLCANGFDFCEEFIKDKTSVVFGCGAGRSEKTKDVLLRLISACRVPLIIDADGLYYADAQMLSKAKCPILITPHIGEFSRLTGKTAEEILSKPTFYAHNFAKKANCTVLLKSDFNLVCDGERISKTHFGTNALATAGTGDVLAGICGALACKIPLFEAAGCASFIHGFAGRFAEEKFGAYSVCASDVSKNIYKAIKLMKG